VNALLEVARGWFQSEDWGYSEAQGRPILRAQFSGKNAEWTCFLHAEERFQQFIFYSECPKIAPGPRRHAVAEFLMRVNFSLTVGNFEIDPDDGHIRFRTSIDVEGLAEVPRSLIASVVMTNVATMDRFYPGIEGVLGGGAPREMLKRCLS
jgi:hypothetical protein